MLSEIVNALCEPDMPVPEVYDLLANAIAAMAKSDRPLTLVARFQLRLLAALGLAPPTASCVRCQKPLSPDGVWLDVDSGGLAGVECRERWREALELSAEDVTNFAALAAARGGGATLFARPRVAEAVELLVSHHLGRRPRSGTHLAEFVRT
jgi:recombinational DNA repair protein (RecF pathway)